MDPDTSQQGRGLTPEQRAQAQVLMRELGRRAAQRLPQHLEQMFLLQLHELLEDFDAELGYTRDDDGIHVHLAGRELLGGKGFFDRAALQQRLVEAGVLPR